MVQKPFLVRAVAVTISLGSAAFVAASSSVGCTQSCTAVGCESGFTVTLTNPSAAKGPLTIDTIGDTTSAHFTVDLVAKSCIPADTATGSCQFEPDGSLAVTTYLDGDFMESEANIELSVLDSGGTRVLHVVSMLPTTIEQPNGPSCEPTCYVAAADVSI
jgi:hypothetical protein